jgi:hypothetical protein
MRLNPNPLQAMALAQQSIALTLQASEAVRYHYADSHLELVATVDQVANDTALLELWRATQPEAVRDLLATAAELAVNAGVVEVPEEIADGNASALLDLAHKTLATGIGGLIGGSPTDQPSNPAHIFAASYAFDRTDSVEMKVRTYAVLATLAEAGKD